MAPETMNRYRGRVWIGFGWVRNGYAWIFPKRDHISVGMGATLRRGRAKAFKNAFQSLLQALFPRYRDAPVASSPISLGGVKQNLIRGHVLLVGEAASLVNPLTAEGIYYAMRSAQFAAEVVDDFLNKRAPNLLSYQRLVDENMGSFFRKSRIFSGLFYGLPRTSFRMFIKDNKRLIRYFGKD
jgi:flavin-dependent dehydrogenase